MRYFPKPSFLLLLLFVSFCSYSQQMVQTPKDLFLICQHDMQFIGKPLKELFKEIKPQIKLVQAREGWVPEVAPLFSFFFTSIDVYKNYRQQEKVPLHLIVYIKEPFKWEYEKRKGFKDKDHYLDWTKEDEEKYGNCIIMAIRVAGEYNVCDYESNIALQ